MYLGPLIAGLGGFGWALVPVFVGLFLLWLIILRPQDFPQVSADWRRPQVLIAFTARGLVQFLLVLVCFGIGRGIGGVLDRGLVFPALLPIGMSVAALVVARMVWDPSRTAAMEKLLAGSLTQVEANLAVLQGGEHGYAEAVTAPLNGLADDVGEAVLERHLSALRALVDEDVTYDVLLARLHAGQASHAGKMALMIMASDGATLERMAKPHAPLQVMQALGTDFVLIARLAERLTDAARQDPDLWETCPTYADLAVLGARLPETRSALSALEAERTAQMQYE